MREEEGDVEEEVGVVEVGLGRETNVWVYMEIKRGCLTLNFYK